MKLSPKKTLNHTNTSGTFIPPLNRLFGAEWDAGVRERMNRGLGH